MGRLGRLRYEREFRVEVMAGAVLSLYREGRHTLGTHSLLGMRYISLGSPSAGLTENKRSQIFTSCSELLSSTGQRKDRNKY
jgi:hypothetical protein